MQISSLSYDSSGFPDLLRQIQDVPKSINVLGKLPKGTYVAVVGTRKCTRYGEQVTYQLAGELAKAGAVIVSGLALGIDGIAHRAALDAGGKTVAVLAHGLDRIYPNRHRDMAREILASGGALVSEYETGIPPLPHQFVERNRIIAGLSTVTIVTESPDGGGAMLTANYALTNNRSVMAVPGNITSVTSAGANLLISKGARPIISWTDVVNELGFIATEATPVPAQSKDEAKLIKLMKTGTSTSEGLIENSGLTAAQFANIISLMEITGKVRNLGAGNWVVR